VCTLPFWNMDTPAEDSGIGFGDEQSFYEEVVSKCKIVINNILLV